MFLNSILKHKCHLAIPIPLTEPAACGIKSTLFVCYVKISPFSVSLPSSTQTPRLLFSSLCLLSPFYMYPEMDENYIIILLLRCSPDI